LSHHPQPATEADRLVNEVLARLEGGRLDAFSVRRYRDHAQKLLKSGNADNAASAYLLLGLIATVEWDVAEAKLNLERAVKLAPDREEYQLNYKACMGKLFQWKNVLALSEAGFSHWPTSLDFLESCIQSNILTGHLHEALRLADQEWFKRTQTPFLILDELRTACACLDANHITEAEIGAALELANGIAHRVRLDYRECNWRFEYVYHPGVIRCVVFQLNVADKAFEYGSELIELLIENHIHFNNCAVLVRFGYNDDDTTS
jgi:tetratricopeptide (TPR) repeat protein